MIINLSNLKVYNQQNKNVNRTYEFLKKSLDLFKHNENDKGKNDRT